jgi:argininosuccinate lyase
MSKLWQKSYSLDAVVERFTVGEDYLLDRALVPADCVASMAHAAMLASIGVLTGREAEALKLELIEILKDSDTGRFTVEREHEDCHTAIENRLTERLGEAGRKIHTGRSRNDQVVAALRLYARDFLSGCVREAADLIDLLLDFAKNNEDVPMPGRTHMQIAMPSSVGLWAAAYAEELADSLASLRTAYDMNNQCPLGSAAGYGVPLPLDREMVAELLGFRRVQNNVLYVSNSRGKIEAYILDAAEQVVLTLSKMAQDLILYSLPEFGYFTLPDELCSGSSIMPQKKNPDGLELLRAKAAIIGAHASAVKGVIRALPGGYNRDFQETKGPFMRGAMLCRDCIEIAARTIRSLEVHPERLAEGFTPGIYATDEALRLVAEGLSFRDAYRKVGTELDGLGAGDPGEAIRSRTSSGTTGNLGLGLTRERLRVFRDEMDAVFGTAATAVRALVGFEVSFFGE